MKTEGVHLSRSPVQTDSTHFRRMFWRGSKHPYLTVEEGIFDTPSGKGIDVLTRTRIANGSCAPREQFNSRPRENRKVCTLSTVTVLFAQPDKNVCNCD